MLGTIGKSLFTSSPVEGSENHLEARMLHVCALKKGRANKLKAMKLLLLLWVSIFIELVDTLFYSSCNAVLLVPFPLANEEERGGENSALYSLPMQIYIRYFCLLFVIICCSFLMLMFPNILVYCMCFFLFLKFK